MPPSALRSLPRERAVLLSSGRKIGLGELHPWYRERDHVAIDDYAEIALGELREAAEAALGMNDPINRRSDADDHPPTSSGDAS